jgi:hypothetical protein
MLDMYHLKSAVMVCWLSWTMSDACGGWIGDIELDLKLHVLNMWTRVLLADLGKAAYRKENGLGAPPGPSSSTLIYYVKTANEQPSCNRLVLIWIQVNWSLVCI